MRLLLLCAPLAVAACSPAPLVGFGVIDAVSISVLGRDTFDVAYSLHTHQNCSIVRLDKGESYCKPPEPPPAPPRFCTRTLGSAECFADPAFLADHPAPVADGPMRLTTAQEKNRTAVWPYF